MSVGIIRSSSLCDRIQILLGRTKMLSRPKLLMALGFILLVTVSIAYAQPGGAEGTNLPQVPYIAEVTGTDVYLRSGPGTSHYYCAKVDSPERVKVINHSYGWSEIIPPEGTFSWISKDFVDIGKISPAIGLVNGNGVRVWAGSDYIEPMRSIIMQVKLNKGDIVKLIDPGLQKSDYYKIAPPPGAHLWISSELLKYVGPLRRPVLTFDPPVKSGPIVKPVDPPKNVGSVVKPGPTVKPVDPPEIVGSVVKPGPKPEDTDIVPMPADVTPGSTEAKRIKECYEIAEKIREELAKPLEVQDHSQLLETLKAIAKDPEAGKAQRYAQYQIDQIKGFELARQAGEDTMKQDADLKKIRDQIRQKRAERIAGIPDPGRHIVKGRLKASVLFTAKAGQQRYKVLNEAGNIVCYAIPAPQAATINLEKYLNKPVGLKGKMVNDSTNPIGLVMFTAIEDLTPVEKKPNEEKPKSK